MPSFISKMLDKACGLNHIVMGHNCVVVFYVLANLVRRLALLYFIYCMSIVHDVADSLMFFSFCSEGWLLERCPLT